MQIQEDKPKKGRPKKIVTTPTFNEVARHDWNSEDECGLFMANLIKMASYLTVLEIGVFEGETSQHLINALPQGGYYAGIDINDYRTSATIAAMESKGKSIDFILGNSLEELKKLPSAHFDLIFIDADHSFDHVLQEFKIAEHLVSKDGVIILHDTIHLEGPRKLVEYAAHYGYKNITLNTTEGRGISILKL
jgi:predicted O-methyltransferase YrrM